MKRIRTLLPAIAAAAILQTTPIVHAQQYGYVATVPFQFSVDNKTLPAGTYRITRQGLFLHIDNQEKPAGITVMLNRLDPSRDGRDAFVFDEINGRFFFRRIETQSSGSSMHLAVSRQEKEAITLARATPAAPSAPTEVAIATGAQ